MRRAKPNLNGFDGTVGSFVAMVSVSDFYLFDSEVLRVMYKLYAIFNRSGSSRSCMHIFSKKLCKLHHVFGHWTIFVRRLLARYKSYK